MNKIKQAKPLCPPDRPPKYEDVVFAEVLLDNGNAMELKMDIYQDLNQKQPGPCIIYYFGGGWIRGEYKQTTQKAVYCRELIKLVEQGYTIVSPAYRLASEAIFPAAIHDCKGAVRFLKAHAEEYHIDPERIGVLGNSAGGHLAAMVACSANCKEMEGDVGGNTEHSSNVKAAAIYYAPLDIVESIKTSAQKNQKALNVSGTEIDNIKTAEESHVECQILGYIGDGKSIDNLYHVIMNKYTHNEEWKYVELARQCSPITYVSKNCPPLIILHGGHDPIVPISQSEVFYNKLTSVGAEAVYVSASSGGHGPSLGKEIDNIAYNFLTSRL